MTLIAIAWLSYPPTPSSPDSREPRLDGNEIVICQLHPSKPPGKTDKAGGRKEGERRKGGGWKSQLLINPLRTERATD